MKSFLKKPLFWGISVGMVLLVGIILLLRKRAVVQTPVALVNSVIDKVPTV